MEPHRPKPRPPVGKPKTAGYRRPRLSPGSIYVRGGDPDTSHDAVPDKVTAKQGRERALFIMQTYSIRGGLTYEDGLCFWQRHWPNVAESVPRKRIGDLKKAEFGACVVEARARRPQNKNGKMVMVLCLRCDQQHPPRRPGESDAAPACLDPGCYLIEGGSL